MAYLAGQQGTWAGKRVEIPAAGLGVGRVADGNQLVLPDAEISRHHARLLPGPQGAVRLEDLSVNGTFVNGQRVQQMVALHPGDAVRFGLDPEA